MQIVVNDEPINFTLENESTVGQVISQLESWLVSQRLAISSLQIDDDELPLYARERWTDHPLEGIETVSITAATFREMRLSALQTMLEYLVILVNGLETRRDPELRDLLDEYPYIRDSLNELVGISPAGGASSALDLLIETSGLLDGTIADDQVRAGLIQHIRDLQVVLMDRMKEVTQPQEEAASAALLLGQMVPQIGEVSLMLQTGKDKEAMAIVIRFTELLGKIVRVVPHLAESNPELLVRKIGDVDLQATSAELNSNLTELVTAFDAQDSVLIGDLLEYEIAPRVQRLARFFES